MSFCLPARYLFVNARHKVRWTGGRWSSVRHVSGAPKEEAHSLSSSRQDNKLEVSLGEKVKETTKTVWYSGIIAAGLAGLGVVLYVVFKELLSSDTPQAVYAKAFERIQTHPRVCDLLGEPIKGFGEESSRGRRQRIKHAFYVKDDKEHLRLKFYVQGIRNRATVHADVVKIDGSFQYYYLFAEMDNYPRETVILEDNRHLSSM